MKKHRFHFIASLLCAAFLVSFTGCGHDAPVPTEEAMAAEAMTVADAPDAIAQLADTAEDYGYKNALSELTEQSTTEIDGDYYYRLQQNYQGIPVYGRTVVCATDENGTVSSLTGNSLDVDENISLTPTVTGEEIAHSLDDYLANVLEYEGLEPLSAVEPDESSLCIYNLDETDNARLAYQLYTKDYEFLVDAHSGEVLACLSMIYTEMERIDLDVAARSYVDINRNTSADGNTYYTLVDEGRNIHIYNANESTLQYQFFDSNGTLLRDRDGTWHTQSDIRAEDVQTVYVSDRGTIEPLSYGETPAFDQEALLLLANLQTVYDYYAHIGVTSISLDGSPVQIDGVYNDYKDGDTTNAYCWGYAKYNMGNMLFSFGMDNDIALDTVGHEYTHAIERRRSGMLYQGESGAIMEALSDIFGELVESWASQREPDWHGLRNMQEPGANNRPDYYKGDHWKSTVNPTKGNDWGYVHNNSTVISHAAYLMYNGIDGTDSKKLNTEELAKLWYRAMLVMPANCDFYTCRQLVELSATSMNLTSEQIACVKEAFDTVGIPSDAEPDDSDVTYRISPGSQLYVYRSDGELCSDYTLVMAQKRLVNIGSNGIQITRRITSAEPYDLTDLTEGSYSFTITDNADTSQSISFTVAIREKYTTNSISISTHFSGFVVSGTVYERKTENGVQINVPVTNAVVEVYAGDTLVDTAQISDAEGIFQFFLPVGTYSVIVEAEGYQTASTTFNVDAQEDVYLPISLTSSVYVDDVYSQDIRVSDDLLYGYHIPRVHLSGNYADAINTEIYNSLYSVAEDSVKQIGEYGYPSSSAGISYRWAVNGNILSLVILRQGEYALDEYMVYNINISSGEEVSTASLIQAAGLSEGEYYEKAKQVLGSRFWSGWDPSSANFGYQYFVDFFNEQLKRTISNENIDQSHPYINENGQLCMIVRLYSLAGADSYWHDLNMIEFELSPYYASEAVKITHAINISEDEAYQIACDYWDYSEGDVAEESGFELYLVFDGLTEKADGNHYYAFRLRWLVNEGHMSTVDYLYINAETGETSYSV